MTKKILCTIIAIICLFMFCINLNIKTNKANAEGSSKVIDMYLIAGQSNAAGYSKNRADTTADDMDIETFDNVWYAGQTDRSVIGVSSISVGSDYTQRFSDFKKKVTVGLGQSAGYIGPEYGMASVFSATSTAEHPTLIFKTAAGNTGLLKNDNEKFGNWYPRSLWETGYEPNIEVANNNYVGILYKEFIENFKRVYNELVANGYTPKVKGMAWMQGERNENCNYNDYKNVLKTFIGDIRKDLADFTQDQSLLVMPFAIGEICSSFSVYDNGYVKQLVSIQREVAKDMKSSNVTSFSTNDLVINGPGNVVMGTDRYHYSFKDAKTLGIRFANTLLELGGQKTIYVTTENGDAKYSISGDKLEVTLQPKEYYKLSQLVLNGTDVTSNAANNKYQTNLTEMLNELVVKFVEKAKYSVEYEQIEGATLQLKPRLIYEGDKLSLKIYPSKGKTISKVLFNNEEMTYNETTKCFEIIPTENGKVTVLTQDDTGVVPPADNPSTPASGCSCSSSGSSSSASGINGSNIMFMVLSLLAVCAVIVKHRKAK